MSQPTSVTRMVLAHGALSLIGLVTVVLTVVLQDDLIRSWAEGRDSLRETLRTGGVAAVKAGDIAPPAFVPVAIVLFVVLVSLIWVLVAFVRLGYGWARLVISGLLLFMVVASVAGIRTSPPAVFEVFAFLSFAVELVAVVFLWQRDTTAFMRGTWQVSDAAPGDAAAAVDSPL